MAEAMDSVNGFSWNGSTRPGGGALATSIIIFIIIYFGIKELFQAGC